MPFGVEPLVLTEEERRELQQLTQSRTLPAPTRAGGAVAHRRSGTRDCRAAPAARLGAPLRSRCAVRFGGLREDLANAPDDPQHEQTGESLRQRQLRELHENAQT